MLLQCVINGKEREQHFFFFERERERDATYFFQSAVPIIFVVAVFRDREEDETSFWVFGGGKSTIDTIPFRHEQQEFKLLSALVRMRG